MLTILNVQISSIDEPSIIAQSSITDKPPANKTSTINKPTTTIKAVTIEAFIKGELQGEDSIKSECLRGSS